VTGDANNPYLPPKAIVADAVSGTPRIRPRAVNVALVLIAVRVLLGIAVLFGSPIGRSMSYGVFAFLAAGVPIAVALTLGWFIARGRNWARIVYLILTILSLLGLAFALAGWYAVPEGVSAVSNWSAWDLVKTFAPPALSVAVVVLLFFPGRAWFRAPSE
jgi:hypothetical protein